MKRIILSSLCLSFLIGQSVGAQPSAPSPSQPKLALLVENRASGLDSSASQQFSDQLAARFGAAGFAVLTPEDLVEALEVSSNPEEDLDRALRENSSAVQLARNVGADYLIIASLLAIDAETKNYQGYGINNRNESVKLRVSARLVGASSGTTVGGATETASRVFRQDSALVTSISDVQSGLIGDAAELLSDRLEARIKALESSPLSPKTALATVDFVISVQDTSVPVVVRTKSGEVVATGQSEAAQPLGVSVEVDGLVVGSAPGRLQIAPGVHRVRLTREGFKDWNRQVNIFDGQTLEVRLDFSEEGLQRYVQQAAFLESLRSERVLTDAEVKRLEGDAERLRQSGIRYDVRVETDEGITIKNENRTLQGNIEN